MIKSLADSIKVGDIVYNVFMQKLVVSSIVQENGGLVFALVDTGLNTHYYSYEDIYFEDLYGESDEEKSWINWAKNNKDFVETFDHLSTIKWIYQQGFAEGFVYRQKISFEEIMQK
jgi:hypothetical protein